MCLRGMYQCTRLAKQHLCKYLFLMRDMSGGSCSAGCTAVEFLRELQSESAPLLHRSPFFRARGKLAPQHSLVVSRLVCIARERKVRFFRLVQVFRFALCVFLVISRARDLFLFRCVVSLLICYLYIQRFMRLSLFGISLKVDNYNIDYDNRIEFGKKW